MDHNIAQPIKYEDFKKAQENYRMSVTDIKLDTVENKIKDLVMLNCKKSLLAFKEENRIPLKDEKENEDNI
jgi:hypothetical protein